VLTGAGSALREAGDWVAGSSHAPTRKLNALGDRLKLAGKIRVGSRKRVPVDQLVCVKAYSRPAAGAKAAEAGDLRPADVLVDCTEHLFRK
jgi:hypothetical protein